MHQLELEEIISNETSVDIIEEAIYCFIGKNVCKATRYNNKIIIKCKIKKYEPYLAYLNNQKEKFINYLIDFVKTKNHTI